MTTIYGIKNCDTMKKAFKWLEENNINYVFHDYRKDGLTEEMLSQWIDKIGYEPLVNKRGTTYRKLTDEQKENITTDALQLMLNNEAMIKRPLLEADGTITLGFKADNYKKIFNQ